MTHYNTDHDEADELKGPDLSYKSIRRYLVSRVPTLRPPPFAAQRDQLNPFKALKQINKLQWNFILVAFFGWTWDAFDFFSVSITVPHLAASFDRSVKDITWGITLVLMLRSVGAVAFGLAGDKWGRKWPFIVNCALFVALEMGAGFVQTYEQFLAVRALFGIAMGGMFGNCAATALEDCPEDAKGIVSGFLQQGYAVGYLLVVIFNRALTDTTKQGWRSLFWFGSAIPVLIIIWRFFLPETEAFRKRKMEEKEGLGTSFIKQGKKACKTHWLIFIYLVLLMTGMNFMSHGSQDLFPTRLTNQLGYGMNASTVTNCVANLGAISGGIIFGHISQFCGRRATLIFCCILGGALIYPWGFSKSNAGVNASVFFLQFAVQGAWGVIPIFLAEQAPEALRSFVMGTAYQLGNLASSAASTIEAKIGEQFPTKSITGKDIYDYGKVMSILMGAVFAYTLIVVFFGPCPPQETRIIANHNAQGYENDSDEYKPQAENVEHISNESYNSDFNGGAEKWESRREIV